MYCASNNGLSIKSVDMDYQIEAGEILFADYPTAQELTASFNGYAALAAKQLIIDQILALEKTQTLRRIREAITGTDNGWLAALNAQIVNLRGQL